MAKLPEAIRRFIARNINSIELLDVLLFLRSHSERNWTIEEVSAELRSSPNSIRRRLEHLGRRHLTTASNEGHRYTASSATDEVLGLLAELYELRRTTVIDAIFSNAPDPLQSFSDAFKVGDEE